MTNSFYLDRRQEKPTGNWFHRVMVLYQEYECQKHLNLESADNAFTRITGSSRDKCRELDRVDLGDSKTLDYSDGQAILYEGGWVFIYSPDINEVGVLVTLKDHAIVAARY